MIDVRTAGRLSVAAGIVFLLTVGYLFLVLGGAGWDLAMFDDPAALLPWVAQHQRLYQGLWLLYFASQACLLAVPMLLRPLTGRLAVALGSAAVIIAMVGLGVLVAASPVLARAYVAGAADSAAVLVLHDVAADVGKDLRLLSEVLLGCWLALLGTGLQRASGHRRWWTLCALGGWTTLVALIKIFVPTIGLEDWLGFLLGLGYLALGVGLLKGWAP